MPIKLSRKARILIGLGKLSVKTCPRCAEQVQDNAKACRFCGNEFGFKLPKLGCGGAALIFLAILLLWPRSAEDIAKDEQELAAATATVRVERLVKGRLRDPESAIFQHLNGGCGYVNSRNGFGGMTGNVQFVVGANDKVAFRDDNAAAFDTVWREHCMRLPN